MNRLKKIIGWTITFIVIAILLMVIFSPYKKYGNNAYKTVEYTIEIDTPVDSVFNYLGNSKNATNWSSFVDHITPLNADQHTDGTVGAIRRCYKEENEEGIIWDEEIIAVDKNERRKLTVYDLQGFSLSANNLVTEQLYKKVSENSMTLTFSLFFDKSPSILDRLKMDFASYQIKSIFEANLENIKRICETGK